MSVIHVMGRPVETFDPTKRKHRESLSIFLQTCKWAHSPVRFVSSDPSEVDVNTMQRQLLEFYTAKEFGEKAAKKA